MVYLFVFILEEGWDRLGKLFSDYRVHTDPSKSVTQSKGDRHKIKADMPGFHPGFNYLMDPMRSEPLWVKAISKSMTLIRLLIFWLSASHSLGGGDLFPIGTGIQSTVFCTPDKHFTHELPSAFLPHLLVLLKQCLAKSPDCLQAHSVAQAGHKRVTPCFSLPSSFDCHSFLI